MIFVSINNQYYHMIMQIIKHIHKLYNE